MEIISTTALISINETLIFQLASFLLFLFLMNRLMFRPLKSTMDEREDFITGLEREVDDKANEVVELLAQLKERETAVISEANTMKLSLEDEGTRKAVEINADVNDQIAKLRRQNEAEVKAQIDEARKSLQKESEELASRIMEKVLDRRLAA